LWGCYGYTYDRIDTYITDNDLNWIGVAIGEISFGFEEVSSGIESAVVRSVYTSTEGSKRYEFTLSIIQESEAPSIGRVRFRGSSSEFNDAVDINLSVRAAYSLIYGCSIDPE
jgi:hypothetical protein